MLYEVTGGAGRPPSPNGKLFDEGKKSRQALGKVLLGERKELVGFDWGSISNGSGKTLANLTLSKKKDIN